MDMSADQPQGDSPPEPAILRYGVAGVVVRERRLLVIRRSHLVRAPGKYCFPGGRKEEGETEESALVREFHEELGVSVRPVRLLWRSVTPWQVSLSWWLAELAADAALTLCADEVESAHWLTIDELRRLPDLLESNLAFLDALRQGEFEL
jgi:8-oxo-dGTP pyrophosphatase MutT (NUDIX family)